MYILVPLLAGYGNSSIFLVTMTIVSTLKLQRLLKCRHIFKRFYFCRELQGKIIWFAFNLIYLVYWLTEILEIDCSKGFWLRVIILADYIECIVFLCGCFIEIAISLIKIILGVKKFLLAKT